MKINEAFKENNLIPNKYQIKKNVSIVNTNKGKFVFKNKKPNIEIYNYLKSRKFDYLPRQINKTGNFQITEYEQELNVPDEQKILDLVILVALLHSKTTHYKEVDLNYYEQIYEDISGNLEYLYIYYTNIIEQIESKVYMSPSEYLLARNISIIYKKIDECREDLEKWHTLVSNKRKRRDVVLHNNLSLDHFIRNENEYLISWEKAKIGSPVFDLYKLYKNHALHFDFKSIFKEYENHYPLQEDERKLLYILITMPPLIEFNDSEYINTKKISEEIDIIYKTDDLTKIS